MKHASDLALKRRETKTRSLLLITYGAADYFSKYLYCPERRVRTNISVAQISVVCVRATGNNNGCFAGDTLFVPVFCRQTALMCLFALCTMLVAIMDLEPSLSSTPHD